ncbi:MAG: tRNA (adenosine(37)-N6)-threonylcarbamoyltransferase complex transferase subunit TsaD [Patescibacteria group bacterium]|jgi:N6-L-threonylcarbamoyladenine synthase|nr:tRNA (adenosine(37)-N6)-threonylcarbamoyltransferase complex transferase subunit TsaD [Patescibacteria group bacterium]
MKDNIYILGIESSCDETAASIVKTNKDNNKLEVLSNIISSQIEIHKKHGGVVPEVAAREHVLNILPTIETAIKKSGIKKEDISAISVTSGPGLITSLISGVETAKSLSIAWDMPLISVNHIEAHIYANFINDLTNINYPAVILTVSGGHTTLLKMNKSKKILILGETRDDAAGEAYDKGAKMLGLGYPGGPIISKYANEYEKNIENKKKHLSINLPRPMINSNNCDFSFSGLKTALLYEIKKDKNWKNNIPAYAYSYQKAIIDTLVSKTIYASKISKAKTVMLSGGVSANKELRKELKNKLEERFSNIEFICPELPYTTDNAAMVAAAGCFKYKNKQFINNKKLKADPNLQLK